MSIDLTREHLLSLTQAAASLPRIDGKRPHISTIWRWCRRGLRGVTLEYVRLGHRVCTSREAMGRFVVRLADTDAPVGGHAVRRPGFKRPPGPRERQIRRAEQELSKSGL